MPDTTIEELETSKPDTELQKLQEDEKRVKAELAQLERLEALKKDIKEYEARKLALQKEEKRLREAILAYREEKRKQDLTFQEKFKKEQEDKAKTKFFADYEYKDPELQKRLLEVYAKIDDGSLDVDNIYKNFQKAHLLLHHEKYVEMEKKMKELEGGAQTFVSQQSSAAFSGTEAGITEEPVILTEEDEEAIRQFSIPREKYIELKKKGIV
jgi:hypothetical protein